MNITKKVAVTTKKFVLKHRTGIAVTLTALACLKLNKMALKSHDEFLKEHDLFEKFYTVEEAA